MEVLIYECSDCGCIFEVIFTDKNYGCEKPPCATCGKKHTYKSYI